MVGLYQFQGGSSPVLCDIHNAKWEEKKTHLKLCEIIMKWKKGLPGAEWHFKHLVWPKNSFKVESKLEQSFLTLKT